MENKRKKLYNLLGDLPPRNKKPRLLRRKVIHKREYIVEKLLLDLNGFEPVPALFLIPHKVSGKLPLVLYNHVHGGSKEEVLNGRKTSQGTPYGETLTKMGYAVLCIDDWAFGSRNHKDKQEANIVQKILDYFNVIDISTESKVFKRMLWTGKVMWGMMVYDHIKAIDYALTRKFIDKKRIATIGFSMGSTMAWWHAALDKRIKVCVDMCSLTDIHEFDRLDLHYRHSWYYYVRGILKHFSTTEINALIAPRTHLNLAGIKDLLTPVEGVEESLIGN